MEHRRCSTLDERYQVFLYSRRTQKILYQSKDNVDTEDSSEEPYSSIAVALSTPYSPVGCKRIFRWLTVSLLDQQLPVLYRCRCRCLCRIWYGIIAIWPVVLSASCWCCAFLFFWIVGRTALDATWPFLTYLALTGYWRWWRPPVTVGDCGLGLVDEVGGLEH
jgi:hypothetical protein